MFAETNKREGTPDLEFSIEIIKRDEELSTPS